MLYDLGDIKSPNEIVDNPLYCFGDALLLYIYEDAPHIYVETLYPVVYKELCDDRILSYAVKDFMDISFVHHRDVSKPIIKKNWLSIARNDMSSFGSNNSKVFYVDNSKITLCVDMRSFIEANENRIKEIFGGEIQDDYEDLYVFLYDRVLMEDEYIAIYNGDIKE